MDNVRVRFAPSPTGTLHVGGIRTALFDFCFAKANNGVFILRIEDTDQERKVQGAEESVKESLKWLGANWDDFAIQSQRLDEYKKHAEELVSSGNAYHDNGAIRFKVNKTGETSWIDAVGNKKVSFQNKDIEDFIILKKDGFPTYHLANVVDDHLMNITHVIRGEDWIPSAPKHIMLYKAFSWDAPVFAHVPNVLGTDGKKLSKRRGAKSVLDFKKEGILSEALFNYLMLLGWSPKGDREILPREVIEKEFRLENINVSPAVFDEKKLMWMNGEYIRQTDILKLKELLLQFDPSLQSIPHFDEYLPLAQTRIKTLGEFRELAENQNTELSDKQKELSLALKAELLKVEWNKDTILEACFKVRDEINASTKDLYLVFTGKPHGLPLGEKLEIDGKDETLSRLD